MTKKEEIKVQVQIVLNDNLVEVNRMIDPVRSGFISLAGLSYIAFILLCPHLDISSLSAINNLVGFIGVYLTGTPGAKLSLIIHSK